jgi:hypothetical protein
MTVLLDVVAWILVLLAPVNVYFLWRGWQTYRAVNPRSPVLRALLWVDFSIWVLGAYFAIVGFRYLYNIEPVLPFGGIGLSAAIIFVLSVPAVVYTQMRAFLEEEP